MNIIFNKFSIFLIILLNSFVFTKNLTLHDFDNPSASHILDSHVLGDLLIVSGMLGGIEFYDISNPQILNHLDNLTLSSGGGGGGTKPNCIIADGNYVYVTTNRGLGVINISNPSNPQYQGIISNTDNYILENLDLKNNMLAVAAHEAGVLLFDLSNSSMPIYVQTLPANNAWSVLFNETFLYIADERNLLIYDINNYSLVNSIELSNAIKDFSLYENNLYVALGTDGVAAINIEDHLNFEIIDIYNTSAMANRIEVFEDGKIAVSDWDDVEILQCNNSNLELIGYKNTTRRTMAISVKDNYIYSAEWNSVQVLEYGIISGPDLDLNAYELNYPFVENGQSYTLDLEVTNNGNQIAEIIDAYTTNNEFSYNQLTNLNPGETQNISITYTANSNNSSGSYRIFSNDEDESEIICETNGNIIGANIGDSAPDFELNIIANGMGSFQLSDYLGQVVVIAFFAPN